MGKLMEFVGGKAYQKAKKNILKNIYKNLKYDRNFHRFYRCHKKMKGTKYRDKKQEFKKIYRELINGDSEKLLEEKERMSVNVQSISFPYSSMVTALAIGIIPNILIGMANVAFPDNKSMIAVKNILIVIYLFVVYISYGHLIIVFEKEAFICITCLNALEELEKEFENQERENEVIEEIATTVEVHEDLYKEKITKIIKGLFKKKSKFEKDKKSQEELTQEFEKLKSLNQEELVERKLWYNREAKKCRDIAKNFKILINYITILITIVSVVIPLTTQMFNIANNTVSDMLDKKIKIIEQKEISGNKKAEEMMNDFKLAYDYKDSDKKNEVNSFGDMFENLFKTLYENIFIIALGGIVIILLISMFSLKYNYRASNYETLAEYINDELIKDKIE